MNPGETSGSARRPQAAAGVRYRFEDCELEPAGYRLLVRGEPVAVEPRVFELIVYLIENRDRLVGKDELLKRLWGHKYVSESTLSRAVYEARRALGDNSRQQRIIKTQHSRGYQFVAPVHEETVHGKRETAPVSPAPGADAVSAAAAEPADAAPPSAPSTHTRSRRALFVAAGLCLAVVVAALVVILSRDTQQEQVRERIAIAPFTVDANAPDLGWAELALPSLLAETLNTRSDVTVFPANRVRQALAQRGLDAESPQEDQVRVLRDVFGVDHVLFAHVSRDRAQLTVGYDLVGVEGSQLAGSVRGRGVGAVTENLASTVAQAVDVAYRAGIPVRKIGPDEFVNEAFARGLHSQLGGQLEDSVRYFEVCLTNDPDNGWAQYELGNALRFLGRWSDAAKAYESARLRGGADGDVNLEGSAETGLGLLAWRQGRLAEAEQYLERAREKYERIDRRASLAAAYGNLGILADNRRDFARARQYYERALALYVSEGERAGESAVYSNLAVIERKLGNLDAAATLQQRAVDLQRRVGLHQMLVFSLAHLGEIERERGNWDRARAAIDESLNFAHRTRDRVSEADALTARAGLAQDFERFEEAAADLRAAYTIYEELGNPAGLARAALRLIEVTRTSAPAEARTLAEAAVAHARQLEDETLILEAELVLAGLTGGDLGPLLPRLQVLGDHRLLALSWAVRARREPGAEPVRAALAHAERAGGGRLQAALAVELARLLIARNAPANEIESVLRQARVWQVEYPPELVTRACHLARIQRVAEAQEVLGRAAALTATQPDMNWCPGRSRT